MDPTLELLFTNLIIPILSSLLLAGIGIGGALITKQLKTKYGLETIEKATAEVTKMALTTVDELQQTLVADLKKSNEDGKLTKEEIANIGAQLIFKTNEKLSQPAINVLNAANIDITNLIKGLAESYINKINS